MSVFNFDKKAKYKTTNDGRENSNGPKQLNPLTCIYVRETPTKRP